MTKEQLQKELKAERQRFADLQDAWRDGFTRLELDARIAAAVAAERDRCARIVESTASGGLTAACAAVIAHEIRGGQ